MTFTKHYNEYLKSFDESDTIIADSHLTITRDQLVNYQSTLSKQLLGFSSVAILLPRSSSYLAYYLTLLSLGKTVLPLSNEWDFSYITFILEDCQPTILLTDKATYDSNFGHLAVIHKVDSFYFVDLARDDSYSQAINSHQSYIVYTSGSTGNPKGVIISDLAYQAYLEWAYTQPKQTLPGFHLVTGSINFDIILADFAVAITSQRPLWVNLKPNNIFETASLLLRKDINSVYFVPSALELCLNFIQSRDISVNDKTLFIYCGGEYLSKKLVTSLFSFFTDVRIFNMYGPSEVTVNCLSCEIHPWDLNLELLPTGFTFPHLEYFFDNPENPCQPNTCGELIVSGIQLLTQYTNFESDKLITAKSGKRYYKTGDFFYTDKKMQFTFSHRIDNEVKIMGNRVNLDLLRDHCMQCVSSVDLLFIYNTSRLLCFYVGNVNESDINKAILSRFPDFCLPKSFIQLSHFPTNKNGKIDRIRLIQSYE